MEDDEDEDRGKQVTRVWLVDASTYHRALAPELAASKEAFFRLETCARERRFGAHAPRGARSFSSGLLEIASLLVDAGVEVRYLTLEDAALEAETAREMPDAVGFGAVTPTVSACSGIAATIRRRSPATRLVLGGPHAAAASQLTRERFPVWDVISGARGLDAARMLAGIGASGPAAPLYELLPHPLHEYGFNLTTYEGCVYRCAYCHDGTIAQRPAGVDGGLAALARRLPERTPVHFCDSVLGGTPQRARLVCDALAAIDHRMLLSCDLRAEFLTPELVRALVAAGFVEVRIGLESADSDVLRNVSRTCLPDSVVRSLAVVRETSALYVSVYFVTGLPGSDRQSGDASRTMIEALFARGLANQVKHHLYVPYPRDGQTPRGVRLTTEDWSSFDRNSYPVYELSSMAGRELWADFLETEQAINAEWRRALHIDRSTADSFAIYSDYNVRVYLDRTALTPARS